MTHRLITADENSKNLENKVLVKLKKIFSLLVSFLCVIDKCQQACFLLLDLFEAPPSTRIEISNHGFHFILLTTFIYLLQPVVLKDTDFGSSVNSQTAIYEHMETIGLLPLVS